VVERKDIYFRKCPSFVSPKVQGSEIGSPGLLNLQNWDISDLEHFSTHPSPASPPLCVIHERSLVPFTQCFTQVKCRIVRPSSFVVLKLDRTHFTCVSHERKSYWIIWKRPLASLFYSCSHFIAREFFFITYNYKFKLLSGRSMSASEPARPRYIFVQQGQLFSSLTSTYLPDIPIHPSSYDNHCPMYSESQTPRWVDPRYPSITFTPLAPRFDNQFGILKAPQHEVVEEVPDNNGGSQCRTPQALCQAFIQLEADLVEIKKVLTNAITFFGMEFQTIPEPSMYGYQCSHGNARTARKAIEQSHDAFIALMANTSYLIALFDDNLITVGPHVGD
jgi:hypothetical protein